MGKEPRKVSTVPQGYEFSHRDEATGRDIYKIKTEIKPVKSSAITRTKVTPDVKKTGATSILKAPIKRKTLPTINEDFVYIEPTKTDSIPKEPIKIYEDLRIDRKLQPPINPNIDYYQYPDANAGYSKSTPMYFDKTTQRPVDVLKSIGSDGKYTPIYTDTLTANEGKYQGTIKQGNPRVTTDPTKTNILPGNEIDKSGTKKGEIVGTTGFKKGGLIQKLQRGGGVLGDENEDGYVDSEEQNNLNQKQTNKTAVKNAASGVLSGVGASYYNSQEPSSQQDATRSAGMAAASQAGPVGGVISGVAAIGDKIGKPIKARSEQLDASGNLVNASKSKRNAIGGSLFSPTKALAYRAETGNWGDVKGDQYNKSIEDKAKSQLNAVNIANKNAKMQQLIDARNNQEENPMLQNAYDTSGATFDANHNLVLANGQQFDPNRPQYKKGGVVGKVKQMCSEGGEIKGKGGPKDDKIEAEVKEDSFVVPAENAELAKGIRKLYLKAPNKKANLKQEEGEPVKLSNGEHLFTPEENEYLESIGIELEDLAPNAEDKEEMKNGGLTAKKARMILHDKQVHGKPLTDQQRKFFGAISSGASVKMACGGEVKGYADGGEVVDPAKELAKIEAERKAVDAIKAKKESDRTAADKARLQKFILETKATNQSNKTKEWEKKYNDSKTKLDALNKAYEDYDKESSKPLSKTDKLIGLQLINTSESIRSKKEGILKDIKAAQAEHDNAKRTYDYVKSGKTYTAPKAETKAPTPKVETKTATTEVKPTTTAPVKTGLKAPKVASNTSKFVAPEVIDNGEEVVVPGDKLSPNERAIANADAEKATVQSAALNKSLPQTVATNGTPQNQRRGLADVVGSIDPTAFVGIGQTALGLNSLRGQVRPVDKAVIDPTYNASVNRSLEDAKFGLTPEQKFLATQDIQNSLNDAKAVGLQTAGGSGVQAFNTNRAAINDAWKNKLGLKQADTEARMAKQKYADAMAADRANILSSNRRQAFNDAMYTFQQKQQAGSELIGAGLQNTIGAYRFKRDQQARDEANNASNAWTSKI